MEFEIALMLGETFIKTYKSYIIPVVGDKILIDNSDIYIVLDRTISAIDYSSKVVLMVKKII